MDYDDDDYYVESDTVDQGTTLLIVTILFCVLTNMFLPCYISLGSRFQKRRASASHTQENGEVHPKCENLEVQESAPLESSPTPDEDGAQNEASEWRQATDDQGRVYYYHRRHRIPTWTKPEGFIDAATITTESNHTHAQGDHSKEPETREGNSGSSKAVPNEIQTRDDSKEARNILKEQGENSVLDGSLEEKVTHDDLNEGREKVKEAASKEQETKDNSTEDENWWIPGHALDWMRYFDGPKTQRQTAPEMSQYPGDESVASGSEFSVVSTSLLEVGEQVRKRRRGRRLQYAKRQSVRDQYRNEHDHGAESPLAALARSVHSNDGHGSPHSDILSLKSMQVEETSVGASHAEKSNAAYGEAANDANVSLLSSVPSGLQAEHLVNRKQFTLGDIDLCCGSRAWWRPAIVRGAFNDLLDLTEWDHETARLFRMGLSYSIDGIVEGMFDVATVALISHYLGTEAVAAYTVVDLAFELTDEFIGGVIDSIAVLCPHAIGARNRYLAGQYVQIAAVTCSLAYIPLLLVWSFAMEPLLLWVGVDEEMAREGQKLARFAAVSQFISGWHDAYMEFLDVIEKEVFVAVVGIVQETVEFVIILILLLTRESTTLSDLGVIWIFSDVYIQILTTIYTIKKGWVSRYLKGMVGNFALKNRVAVRTMFKLSLPLCFGSLIEYGEWEILTIFAAPLGTAEVAVWGMLGSLWDLIEATSEAIGDAGEIRCAYHLGFGRPLKAKMASYKAVFWGVYAAIFVTSIIFILGEDLAKWFTSDPRLQRMVIDLVPFVGIGNITMTAGSVSWAIVGAQGRYKLSTIVQFVTSWGVTMPLGAIFCFVVRLDLQGLASAVVLGSSVAGTTLTYLLAVSDWDSLSAKIVQANKGEDEDSE